MVKPVKYKENIDPNTPLRLNKYLANAGVCSRREADAFITSGVVKVNGEVVKEVNYPLYFRNVAPDKLPKEGTKISVWASNLSQSINPFWVIVLTPLVVAFFTFLSIKISKDFR